MKEVNGTFYHDDTPNDLVALLEQLRVSRQRVKIVYGNPATGKLEDGAFPERGTIGRSMGPQKIPLLVKTKRSLGGEALGDAFIVQVCESPGNKVLWQRK